MYWCLFIVKSKLKKGIRGGRERERERVRERMASGSYSLMLIMLHDKQTLVPCLCIYLSMAPSTHHLQCYYPTKLKEEYKHMHMPHEEIYTPYAS
jgi:hypothetical protein